MRRYKIYFLMIVVGVICIFLLSIDGYCSDKKTDRWIRYGTSMLGDHYYDSESVAYISQKVIKVWEKLKHSKISKDKIIQMRKEHKLSIVDWDKLDYDMNLYEIDCMNNTYRHFEILQFTYKGNKLDGFNYPDPNKNEILPESMDELLLRKICK